MTTDRTYLDQHFVTMNAPNSPHERAIVALIEGFTQYRHAHEELHGATIGTSDYVLSPAWTAIGKAIITLLNGETGNLDCGTLDAVIRYNFRLAELEVTA